MIYFFAKTSIRFSKKCQFLTIFGGENIYSIGPWSSQLIIVTKQKIVYLL
jgi:hypothetical protein